MPHPALRRRIAGNAMKRPFLLLCAAAVAAFAADESYRKPPQEILDVLNAPQTPAVSVSPSGTAILFAQPIEYPPISEVGAPMLRLAGIRINPKTNGPHRALFNSALSLRRVNDGSETKIQLPPNARVMLPRWSPDGKRFAFTNTTDNAGELINDLQLGYNKARQATITREIIEVSAGATGRGR